MNRTWKIILIAVALIVCGGIVAGIALFAMGGISGTSRIVTNRQTISEDFSNIDVDIFWADLTLHPSPDDTCYYIANTYENMLCSATVENGTLKVSQREDRKWYQQIGFFRGETSLEVYLPKDAYRQLTVKADTGKVTVPQNFTFDSATITTSTGNMDISCQIAGQLNLSCSTGHINLRNLSAKAVTAAASTGHIAMDGITCDSLSVSTTTGNCSITNAQVQQLLTASSSTGDKQLTNVTCGSLNLKASTGDSALSNVVASGDAKLKSNTGDWKFTRFDAANILIETDTGDVEGTLLSDKIFFTDTDTGDVEVPRTTTGGTCQIITDTGDIEIDIVP